MGDVSFADVVHQSISFSAEDPAERLVLALIDTRWFQRLRDVSQTANTKLVYMFSEHSRFGHSIGVAYLACRLMEKLARRYRGDVEPYRQAVAAAALLHDIGHLAPGSHAATRVWFPGQKDRHEQMAINIINGDAELQHILQQSGEARTAEMTAAILAENKEMPPWTWEIISGGGWNADRGNWCIVDSILAGVSYGKYNIPALTDSIVLTADRHLALTENRLDAMTHFAISRRAMYRQVYQHRVLLAADTLGKAIVRRARDLGERLEPADESMRRVIAARSTSDLDLPTVFWMRESWWRYHLARWCRGSDGMLADLADRMLHRRLFKTVRVRDDDDPEELRARARGAVDAAGFDPRYYLHEISTGEISDSDSSPPMLVQLDDGRLLPFQQAEALDAPLPEQFKFGARTWLAMPAEAKKTLGRSR